MDLAARNNDRKAEVALGMVLLGVIFSSMMYGIMLTQIHKYYARFKQDAVSVKLVVFAVLLLNTASMFFVGHAAWYYMVEAGPPLHSIWSLSVELILSIIMSGLSETYESKNLISIVFQANTIPGF
ncbi:hypothetical protein HYPSUDRAFT_283289 [Hypholoma sublateritium FD-334 SS-4]|uniref:Uncharacterized protein n=1 Tax=Hypholoma sublateritium (strain FD-334 SS-4) TaxID=945553 RepID=A0A0D2NJA5_HYPSF|nr:hypothetical protein HYPSUDRAFT_283289 [Hypholoma sublateritium FD-334 SS-4]